MKNKKTLTTLVIIIGALGLITTGAVFVKRNKFSQFFAQHQPSIATKEAVKEKSALPSTSGSKKLAVGQANEVASVDMQQRYLPNPGVPTHPGDALEVENRIYEKIASYDFIVNQVDQYFRSVKEYVLSIDGRVLNSYISSTERYQYGYMTTKVPVDKFEEATQRVADNTKKTINQQVNSLDKTGQSVQLEDALTRLEEQKLDLEIQLEEAETDLEKKRIQLQISRIENQIEQTKQSQENLSERVSYATLTVSAADSEAYYKPGTYQPTLKEQIDEAWTSFKGLLYLFAYVGIWFAVYSLLWLPLVLLVFFLAKKRGKKGKINKKSNKN
ncbi:MAG: DUF4349 domain-containing protein [Patescibacteria group bacterium]|nr:DUF4349 domain-containing protein [Patescibacteria group bacterium]